MEVNGQDANGATTPVAAETRESTPDAVAQQVDARDAEIVSLRKEIADLKAKSVEYLDGWQRARAEFSNYKKRQETDYAGQRSLLTSALIARLLPVLDDFERASKTLAPTLRDMTWIEGVLLIHRKLQLILESEGIKPIEVKANDVFDPSIHEAVSQDDAEGVESGHVIDELQRGYKLGDRVIRPTLVRVAR
ncbi:MAG TPA: nucleotide exchange factor GrpE [Anaerolineae bacterium]